MKKTVSETKVEETNKIGEVSVKDKDVKQILINLSTRSTLKFWLIGLVFVFL
jgi:hypothetical protein